MEHVILSSVNVTNQQLTPSECFRLSGQPRFIAPQCNSGQLRDSWTNWRQNFTDKCQICLAKILGELWGLQNCTCLNGKSIHMINLFSNLEALLLRLEYDSLQLDFKILASWRQKSSTTAKLLKRGHNLSKPDFFALNMISEWLLSPFVRSAPCFLLLQNTRSPPDLCALSNHPFLPH